MKRVVRETSSCIECPYRVAEAASCAARKASAFGSLSRLSYSKCWTACGRGRSVGLIEVEIKQSFQYGSSSRRGTVHHGVPFRARSRYPPHSRERCLHHGQPLYPSFHHHSLSSRCTRCASSLDYHHTPHRAALPVPDNTPRKPHSGRRILRRRTSGR